MINIRPAAIADQEALGRYGAALMHQHHAADPRRFILTDRPESGYGRFLVSRLSDPNFVVLVAELSGETRHKLILHREDPSCTRSSRPR